MNKPKRVTLELSEPELRILLGLCAKELIPQLYRDDIDPNLFSLLKKGTDALAPQPKDDAKEKIPG